MTGLNVPSRGELIHLQLQAMLREHSFPATELFYLGEETVEGVKDHYYLINGIHTVPARMIEDLEGIEVEEDSNG
tara:strand:+ start:2571 stop:2795 length:225 start_codon:yes stop_codon:yes gene_type:complete